MLFLFSFNVLSDVVPNCQKIKTQVIFKGQKEINIEEICFINKAGITFLVSKSCENAQCDLLKKKIKNIIIPENNSSIGSPGFKLCYELGGVPQIFEFTQSHLKSESTDRCFYGKSDFVEISLLLDIWRGKVVL